MKPIMVRSLLGRKEVDTALICLKSLVQCYESEINFVLHDDGTLLEEDFYRLQQTLPVSALVRREYADKQMEELLVHYPNCKSFREGNILGLKLFDIPMLSEGDMAYCDSDVLFLKRFKGLFDKRPIDTSFIFMADYSEAYSVRPWHLLGHSAIQLPHRVNTGLISMSEGIHDIDFLEAVLSNPRLSGIFNRISAWVEQTCWAALGLKYGLRLWEPRQLAVMNPNLIISSDLIGIHFVSTFRDEISKYQNQLIEGRSQMIDEVRTVEARKLSAITLAKTQAFKRLQRFFKN